MTIMTRGAAKFWWQKELPPDVAYLTKNHPHDEWVATTYRQILDKKIAKQNGELQCKRAHTKRVAGFIWVFYNKGWIFGGWYLYVKTLKRDFSISFGRDGDFNRKLIQKVMGLYPCGVIPMIDNFDEWSKRFATQFKRPSFKRKDKCALVRCWCDIDEYGRLKDIHKLPIVDNS